MPYTYIKLYIKLGNYCNKGSEWQQPNGTLFNKYFINQVTSITDKITIRNKIITELLLYCNNKSFQQYYYCL